MKNPFSKPVNFVLEKLGYSKAPIVLVEEKKKAVSWEEIPEDFEGVYESLPQGMTSIDYLKAATGWVYSCISAICDEIASIEFHLFEIDSKGEMKEVFEHNLLDILYRVNNFTTKFDHFWLTQEYLELSGEAPWALEKNSNEITSIYLLRPDRLKIEYDKEKLINYYLYKKDDGTEERFKKDDIILIKYPNPVKPLRGRGTLEAAEQTVNLDKYSEKWNLKFMYNSARPDTILKTEQVLGKEQRKYLEDLWNKKFRGIEKSGKMAILEKGLSYQAMQISQKDMDFLEQQRFTRDKILSIFRVPKSIIAITDDVNRSNAEIGAYAFARWTIKPKMKRIVEQLNEFFVPMFGDNLYLTFDDPVPEDVALKLKIYESAINTGWMTRNEVRKKESLEDVDGGDQIYIPFNLMPLGESKPEKPMEGKTIEGRNILKRIHGRNKEMKIIHEGIGSIVKEYLINKRKNDKKGKEKTEMSKEEKFWRQQIFISEKFEKKFRIELKKLFEVQRRAVIRRLEEKAINIPDILLNIESESMTFVISLTPLIREILKEEGKLALIYVGVGGDIDMTTAQIVSFLKKKPIKFAKEVNKYTNELIRAELEEGIRKGEGIGKIATRINEIFDNCETVRSFKISRTETSRATNFVAVEGYRQSGVVKGKEWLTAFDERTCEECISMNGKVVELDENFFDKGEEVGDLELDYDNVGYPPLHVNCRCTTIPIIGRRNIKVEIDESKKKEVDEEIKKLKETRKKVENLISEKDE